jgi:parallel beta-helix repeat protein
MAVKTLGIMSHYIVDVSVFGHVMGSGTDWGAEVHHSDYETYVNERTNSYDDEFNTYLVFDGSLDFITAYDAACALAYDTTFDIDGDLTCVWMDENYNWNNSAFKNRAGESLNLAVNYLSDVLHTFYIEAQPPLVQNINTGLNYTKVQDAINAPETLDGHTVMVYSGIYYEHVVANKTVSLIGENKYATIIDGNGTGGVVYIATNSVNVTGFTIQNGYSGFTSDFNSSVVSDNIVSNNQNGIAFNRCNNSLIQGNIVRNSSTGIEIWYSNNTWLINNNVSKSWYGIRIKSTNNVLRNNSMTDNHWNFAIESESLSECIHDIDSSNTVDDKPIYYWINQHNRQIPSDAGFVAAINSSDITLRNVSLMRNNIGVLFWNTTDSIIEHVHVSDNWYGIALLFSDNNTLCNSTISNSAAECIIVAASNNNHIAHNNFINYGQRPYAEESFNNTWDDGYPSGGNYWSDYMGVDLYKGPYQNNTGSDGIGDTPYVIDAYNRDKYPLMYPTEITLYAAPSPVEFWTPAYNKTFTVDVKIASVTKLYGFEFKLYWNTTLLDLINVTVTLSSVWGTNYFVGMNDTREDLGRYWLAVAALNPAPSFTGSATLVKLTFKVTYDPIYPNNVTSMLDVADTELSDSEANPIPHDTYDGEYWCYSTKPRLEAKPSTYTAKILGENFTINITVANIVNLYSFEFQLSYNTTILDAMGVTVGPFLKSPYHINKQIIDDAAGIIWLSVESQAPASPANGSGTLATITFMVPMGLGIWYKGFVPLECDMQFNSTMLKTNDGVTVSHDAPNPLFHYVYMPILGDLNSDGIVNIFDLRIVARAFGSLPGEPNWDPRADLNCDNEVDIYDLVLISKNYGRTTP